MRVLTLLLAAVVLAGCASDSGGSPTPTPTASPTPSPTTGTTPTPTGATPSPTATPTPGGPKEIHNETFDFTTGDATGNNPKTVALKMDAGYAQLRLVVKWEQVGAAPGSPPISLSTGNVNVAILDSDGTVVAECKTPSNPPEPCDQTAASTPGEHTLRFSGAGNFKATVLVTEL